MRHRPLSPFAGTGGPNEYEAAVDPQRRLWVLLAFLVLPLLVIGGRLAWLQLVLPERYVAAFEQTTTIREDIPARDGRILAADGSVLAADEELFELLMHYRWLEEPANPDWLRQQALSRLHRFERRHDDRVAKEKDAFLMLRADVWSRLASDSGMDAVSFASRRQAVQARVERIRASVLKRRNETASATVNEAGPETSSSVPFVANDPRTWGTWLVGCGRDVREAVVRELTSAPERPANGSFAVAEELEYHVVARGLDPRAAVEIESHPELYPGVRIRTTARRHYPRGSLAAHVLGSRTVCTDEDLAARHRQSPQGDPLDYRPGDRMGRGGLELSYNSTLRGLRGEREIVRNRRGEILSTRVLREPVHGRDVVLSLDADLQGEAEHLLAEALRNVPDPLSVNGNEEETEQAAMPAVVPPTGGSVVVLDVQTGGIVAAASAPGFDPNIFTQPDPARWNAWMSDPRRPFFSRTTQMAFAPGSTFKALTAIACLQAGTDPNQPFQCEGFLDRPDSHRCLIYRHYGVGHNEVTLAEALCKSCNVYFFHEARRHGPRNLVHWARVFGFGQRTGVDLPSEEAGFLPSPDQAPKDHPWYPGETLGLAIGQSRLRVTPLQMARFMAAIANQGRLVRPHFSEASQTVAGAGDDVIDLSKTLSTGGETIAISGLKQQTLPAVRHGLDLVVNDPSGTAYKTTRLGSVRIAGKTGTAETGGGRPDHAWFAGYVPADEPRFALVVVLEHGGSGGKSAGPLVKRLVERLVRTGLIPSTTPASPPDSRRPFADGTNR